MANYVVNVDGAIIRDEDYLLIERGAKEEHAAGKLGFPGGKVEASPNEDAALEETIRREIREEVGLEVGDVAYVHSNTFEMNTGQLCLNVVMLCEYAGGTARAKAGDEVAAVHWLSYEEVKSHASVPEFTERFVELVEEHRTPSVN